MKFVPRGVSDGQKEGERRGWDNRNPVPSPHRPLQIKHGRPNKRSELAMLRRPKKKKKKRKAQNILTTRSTRSVENMQLKCLMF